MPTIRWSVDDQELELTDRGALGVKLAVPGQPPLAIPPMTLGAWPVPFPERALVLRTVRNLNAVRFQLLSDGHLVPRSRAPRRRMRAMDDARCAAHPELAAYAVCLRCGTHACKPCTPDGVLCAPCMARATDDEIAQARRLRRLGLTTALALGASVLFTGLLVHGPRLVETGIGALVLSLVVAGRGLLAERRERARHLPTAMDP